MAHILRRASCMFSSAFNTYEGFAISIVHLHSDNRSPYDTKTRRARELRRRVNYLLKEEVEYFRKSPLFKRNTAVTKSCDSNDKNVPNNLRHAMPDFLPDTKYRDSVMEALERVDMYMRRSQIEIPEFYVGVEVMFDAYSTSLHSIAVLKLEKRMDGQLFYLRDAPHEYSTVPFDFKPVVLPRGSPVPINSLKVTLNPRPWLERWERRDLQGAEVPDFTTEWGIKRKRKFFKKQKAAAKPWETYDLMRQHRECVDDDEAVSILEEVQRETGGPVKGKVLTANTASSVL